MKLLKKILKAYKNFFLWIKQEIKIANLRYPFLKWIAAGLALVLLIAVIKWKIDNGIYAYIDLDNNKGVAVKCWVGDGNLICDKAYNGKILVKQYWRIH